ncbi:MAG: glycosyltransferase [Pyrinomonadaceae bacterium]
MENQRQETPTLENTFAFPGRAGDAERAGAWGGELCDDEGARDFAPHLEYALRCLRAGEHERAVEVCNSLLHARGLPPGLVEKVIASRALSLEALYPKVTRPPERDNKIKVCVPFHNPGPRLDACVMSLLYQEYQKFEVVFIDDASADGSHARIPQGDARVTLIRNETRQGRGVSLRRCVESLCEPEDVVFPLDGSHRLAYCDALKTVNDFFNSYDCSVMYGQYRYASGALGLTVPLVTRATFDALREAGHAPTPFIFRARAYQEALAEDTGPRSARVWRGDAQDESEWHALCYALLEKSGARSSRFSDHILAVV